MEAIQTGGGERTPGMYAPSPSSSHRYRRAVSVIGAGLLAVGLVACGDDGGGSSAATTAAPSATTTGAAATSAVIVIKDVKFQTPDVTIKAGGQVTFDNQDTQPHTATGDNRAFDTDDIAAGAKKVVTLATAGSYTYHCAFHPFMTGTITVN
jgi:plastocyanin